MTPFLLMAAAIVAEVTGTLALRSSDGFSRVVPSLVVVASYGIAFGLLSIVLRSLPVGFVYAVWSAIGVAAIAVLGRVLFGDPLPLGGIAGIGLIVAGVVVLQLSGAGGH